MIERLELFSESFGQIAALAIQNLISRLASVSSAIVILIVALALIFAGRFVIRVIAFFGVGLVFAAAAASIGAIILGIVGFVIGGAVGFFVGGLLSFVLLPLAIGVSSGIVAYDLSQSFIHVYPLALIVGVVFFVLGVLLSMKLLSLATVIFGGLLLFRALVFFHFPPLIALVVTIIMGAIGFWAQDGLEKKHRSGYQFVGWSKRTPPASAVPVNPRPTTSQGATRYCSRCGTRIDDPTTRFCPNCGANLT